MNDEALKKREELIEIYCAISNHGNIRKTGEAMFDAGHEVGLAHNKQLLEEAQAYGNLVVDHNATLKLAEEAILMAADTLRHAADITEGATDKYFLTKRREKILKDLATIKDRMKL